MQGITIMVGHHPNINKSYGGNNSYGGPKGEKSNWRHGGNNN